MTTCKDYTGQRLGRYTVLEDSPSQGCKRKVKARCDCGTVKQVLIQGLVNGRTQSCGCLHKEKSKNWNSVLFRKASS